jgi:haloalkane dehalogenase
MTQPGETENFSAWDHLRVILEHTDPRIVDACFVNVENLRLHYREAGAGPPVVLLHGWPTSSSLWRNVMPPMVARNRVIALDLPGFGASDKPPRQRYDFEFYARVLNGFLDALGERQVGLAVHDLGGPVGLYWAISHPERLSRLALLNTLVYPRPSWMSVLFILWCRTPLARNWLVSPAGLRFALRLGVSNPHRLTEETIQAVQAPFTDPAARRVLLKTATDLSPRGMLRIARELPRLKVPVRIVYGTRDRILPDVVRTMARVKRDLPQAVVTALTDCGHFLQEERPEELGQMLSDFFA